MSRMLAVSASGKRASAALFDGIELRGYRASCGVSHSSELSSLLDELMEDASLCAREIDVLAVDIGPGSFTGVRIGVSLVNGIALALNRPVIPISSLLALRHNLPDIGIVASMIDARNESVYAAVFDGGQTVVPPQAYRIADFISKIPGGAECVGDGALAYEGLILSKAENAHTESGLRNELTAVSVGKAALAIIKERSTVKYAEPLYLRPSQAERMRGKR